MKKKSVTIKDIAKTLGVSHSTISRALSRDRAHMVSEEMRRTVRQTAKEMNYKPNLLAKGFVTGKTGTLGLLTTDSNQEPMGTQIDCFVRAARLFSYRLLVGLATDTENRSITEDRVEQIEQFVSRGVDGLLLHSTGEAEEVEFIRRAVDDRVPVVTFPNAIRGSSAVVLDTMAGFRGATAYLAGLGHERIGFLGTHWDKPGQDSAPGKGYFQAMIEHDLTPRILEVGLQHSESGYRLSRETNNLFSAVVCCSDYVALGLCRGTREMGMRVPDDLAVVGNGDLDVSSFVTPALTTQSMPAMMIAEAAMNLMNLQFEFPQDISQTVLTSTLVIRDSSGAGRVRH